LLGFVVPLWTIAGLADWVCHRRTDIEHTAGTREALIHLAMMTEAGTGTVLGLLFEINAGVIAATYTALALHQATAVWDVSYADDHREVTPTEQHIHGLLEQVPVMASMLITVLHWDEAVALVGRGRKRPDFRLRRKRQPLPGRQIGAVLAGMTALGLLPYLEEIARCRRATRRDAALA
jgi:hypothetical protein